ncbi:MAG: hypothetical protein QM703_04685 [Gemmatales bacterium]
MLQFLSRRWWGVTGWGYLLSLGLAGVMFFSLTRSAAVAQLTLQGILFIDGFMHDQKHLMITQSVDPRIAYYAFDIESASVVAVFNSGYLMYMEPCHRAMVVTKKGVEHEMFIVTNRESGSAGGEERIIVGRVSSNQYLVGEGHSSFDLKAKASVDTEAKVFRVSLTGHQVISLNNRWLLYADRSITPWKVTRDWFQKWQAPAMPSIAADDGYLYQTNLFDCDNKRIVATIQTTEKMPEYAISPQGDSFVVIEYHPETAESTITKYSLPLGPAYHSVQQWCLILAAFGVPVGLMMLRNVLRRMRRMPVSVPPHP